MRYVFIVLVFAFLLSGAVAGGYYYYFLIPEKVERKVLEGIASLGLHNFTYNSIEKDGEKISIRGVTLDKDGFSTIDEINVHFSLSQIFFKSDQARSIHIKGMRLSGSFKDDVTPKFDGWIDNNSVVSHLKNLPTRTLVIDAGVADLQSDNFGGIQVNYTLQFNRHHEDTFGFVGKISTRQNRLSFHSKISGQISDSGNSFSMETEQISATLPHLKVRRGTAKIDYRSNIPNTYAANLHLASLVWNGLPLSDVKGNITYSARKHSAALKGSTFGETSIPWTVSYQQDGDRKHDYRVNLTPNSFADFLKFIEQAKGIKLSSPLPPFIIDSASKVEIHGFTQGASTQGTLIFSDGDLEHNISGDFSSNDSLQTITGRFAIDKPHALKPSLEHIHFTLPVAGQFSLTNFWTEPNLTLGLHSKLSSGSLDFGVFSLSEVKGDYSYDSDKLNPQQLDFRFKLPLKPTIPHKGLLYVTPYNINKDIFGKAQLDVYSGSIMTEKPIMLDNALSMKNSLIVQDLNIAQLFADAGFENVFVSGLLGGIVPIHFNDNEASVSGGILQSQGAGIIKLPRHISIFLFPGETERMRNIRASLENYRYEFFEIRFDGNLAGRVLMTLSARGRNPELGQKEPVDLNLQIETKISTLFQNLLE